jgi:metal-sulfur cluster biosynthetic enzyme
MNEVISNNPEKYNKALAALQHVMDPEIGLNIVDLGLIYQIDFEEDNKKIFMAMTLTTQFCPMGDGIRSNAGNAVEQTFPGYTVYVELVFDPAWSPDRISDEGRQFLNH